MRGIGLALVLVSLSLAAASAGVPEPSWSEAQKTHWAFLPPKRPAVPATTRSDWSRNPIDRFILKDLEDVGLSPAAEADKLALIRRVRFDLTGLPPSPREVDTFLADVRPDAYEHLVDRLLTSPEYGERWARPWLDLARYSESDGFKSDKTRPNAWRYRDWVIKALNADLPYDRFVSLQLAGDEVAPEDPDSFIATGFNRNYPFEDNNMVPGLNQQLMLDDMTDTSSSVFLGLTVGCARCHDHKYDPISQKDYYRIEALFAATAPKDDRTLANPFDAAVHRFVSAAHGEKVDAVKKALNGVEQPHLVRLLKDKLGKLPPDVRKAIETEPAKRSAFQEDLLAKNAKLMTVDPRLMKAAMSPAELKRWETMTSRMQLLAKQSPAELPSASGMTDRGPKAPPVFLLRKGTFGQPVEEVAPGFLSVLNSSGLPSASSSAPDDRSTKRRLALASWLTRADHPLTSRVMVNRLWQGHFGRGIVATPSDFGTQGSGPSNAPLLDWLATEFIARGWSMKAMHRLMVTSSTYRQSSTPPAKTLDDDPENTLFGRMPRHRLEGEAVRDAMLAVSGQLNPTIGGPSVFPDLPPGVQTRGGWTRSEKASDRNRRSIYVFSRRNLKYPLFDAFDAPDPNVTCPERNVSVNAPQALMLLNSELILDSARAFASRVRKEVGTDDPAALVTRVYRLALGREPDTMEREKGVAFVAKSGGKMTETLADFCHAMLNVNEFVFVD
ncbi:MAG: Protein of unknown function (DUF1553)/Protein of unknown function [Planctomycetota bacterium]|nr:Protein of unknown function (DUF1553)/Protein of unknown function [Planctomycetota bacterium]